MPVTRVNHTAISVRDMDRSIEFYQDQLGLEVLMEVEVDRSCWRTAPTGR